MGSQPRQGDEHPAGAYALLCSMARLPIPWYDSPFEKLWKITNWKTDIFITQKQ